MMKVHTLLSCAMLLAWLSHAAVAQVPSASAMLGGIPTCAAAQGAMKPPKLRRPTGKQSVPPATTVR